MFGVLLGGAGVAGAELEAGVGFPGLAEPPWGGQLDVGDGVAPVGEDPASPDRSELGGVADGGEPPVVVAYEVDEAGEVVGGSHAGFVEDHGRAGRPRGCASPVAGEEPGEGVGRAAGFGGEHVGGFARRGEPDHRPTLGGERSDGAGGGGRLASASGPDHDDELIEPGDRLHGSVLRVEALGGDRRVGVGPPLQLDLIVERLGGGEQSVGDGFRDRSTVPPGRTIEGRADLDAALLGVGGEAVDVRDELDGGRGGTRWNEVGEVSGDVGTKPGRGLVLHEPQRLPDEGVVLEVVPRR